MQKRSDSSRKSRGTPEREKQATTTHKASVQSKHHQLTGSLTTEKEGNVKSTLNKRQNTTKQRTAVTKKIQAYTEYKLAPDNHKKKQGQHPRLPEPRRSDHRRTWTRVDY